MTYAATKTTHGAVHTCVKLHTPLHCRQSTPDEALAIMQTLLMLLSCCFLRRCWAAGSGAVHHEGIATHAANNAAGLRILVHKASTISVEAPVDNSFLAQFASTTLWMTKVGETALNMCSRVRDEVHQKPVGRLLHKSILPKSVGLMVRMTVATTFSLLVCPAFLIGIGQPRTYRPTMPRSQRQRNTDRKCPMESAPGCPCILSTHSRLLHVTCMQCRQCPYKSHNTG
eukprot:1146793-Pelagomonas_calceolata.AAC.2